MKMEETERCQKCNKRFGVSELGGGMPGTKEREDITCPHCRYTIQRTSDGVFQTHALPEDKQ